MFAILFSVACAEVHEHTAPAVNPEDSVAMMTSYGVNTLISDSGVIKYRIVSERWVVNTTKQPSRWEFMKGVFFEKFDEKFRVQAYVQADTAWYYDQKRLWELRGRVKVRTIDGMIYNSEELFWDGITHEFYSYAYSHLVTPDRTLEGTYFRSDENMNHYTVSNSKGSFVNEDIEGETNKNTASTETTDTVAPPAIRPASKRHAATK
ncbi:MAG: LPS export ABC transporter periplasmic protein LptC [Prevotella sp.]|nr:LPS export ABC transporter periplasmic protein LptC [Prevotella sp.]